MNNAEDKEIEFKLRLSKLLTEFNATLSYSHDDDGIDACIDNNLVGLGFLYDSDDVKKLGNANE